MACHEPLAVVDRSPRASAELDRLIRQISWDTVSAAAEPDVGIPAHLLEIPIGRVIVRGR